MELETLLEQVSGCAREAGRIMRGAARDKEVREKSGRRDLVTRYDRQIQAFLEERLLALAPEAGFLGEEAALGRAEEDGSAYRFIVDPIDGTTNFVWDYGRCCVSIALARGDEAVLGVICDPYRDEVFSALRGRGAFCNGAPVHVTAAPLERTLAIVGTSPYYPELADVSFAVARRLFDSSLDIRRSGSSALDLCHVAAGRAGCFFEGRLSPWDYAAGSLILQEAGGVVTEPSGAPLTFTRKCSVAAGSPACHAALLAILRECGAA